MAVRDLTTMFHELRARKRALAQLDRRDCRSPGPPAKEPQLPGSAGVCQGSDVGIGPRGGLLRSSARYRWTR